MFKGGMGDLMKQAQQMQSAMKEAQEKAAEQEVSGEAGAGLVTVVMNGRHDVRRVAIDDSVFREEKSVLEDLLAAAVNDAVRKVETANREAMAEVAGGLELPPGMKLPF